MRCNIPPRRVASELVMVINEKFAESTDWSARNEKKWK